MNWRCFFGRHELDDSCTCGICGKIRHHYVSEDVWEDLGLDSESINSYGIWANKSKKYIHYRCTRCGDEYEEDRGIFGWK